jgi:pimeloyl-ACP methyl ester carboxylesterase
MTVSRAIHIVSHRIHPAFSHRANNPLVSANDRGGRMIARHETLTLPDGRRLAYCECGEQRAPAVFVFHGLPGSRLECHPDAVRCRSARLVMTDRPGFGASDPHPQRELLDWPSDVAALADHLGVDAFSICAWSGGGPYGLACAYSLSERVRNLVLISSISMLDDERVFEGMWPSNAWVLRCARHAPYLLRLPVSLLGAIASWSPAWRLDELAGHLCPSDQAALADPRLRELMLADTREALRMGPAAVERELALIARDWRFDLGQIRTPVTLIHGDDDAITPPPMGTLLAQRLRNCRFIRRRGEGHFLMFTHWKAIIRLATRPAPGGSAPSRGNGRRSAHPA